MSEEEVAKADCTLSELKSSKVLDHFHAHLESRLQLFIEDTQLCEQGNLPLTAVISSAENFCSQLRVVHTSLVESKEPARADWILQTQNSIHSRASKLQRDVLHLSSVAKE
ncbi:MAG: hypothetical protein P4L53_03740 [Candidatus Obscuribacterales bacterium]|nr:hypothetical protein [Candidatus Obscuribacterales bacterium]